MEAARANAAKAAWLILNDEQNMKSQREGWLGEDYVRIYAASDRARVAEVYDFSTLLPGYTPLGSWGLDALCLGPDSRVYLVDWIPLAEAHRRERYRDMAEFESELPVSGVLRILRFESTYGRDTRKATLVHSGASCMDCSSMPTARRLRTGCRSVPQLKSSRRWGTRFSPS